jgi:type III secretion system YopN/LcrE/InvE/MxiC family regulator
MLNISTKDQNVGLQADNLQLTQGAGSSEGGERSIRVVSNAADFGAEVVEDQEFTSAFETSRNEAETPEDRFEDYLKHLVSEADGVTDPQEAQEISEQAEKATELVKRAIAQSRHKGGSTHLSQKEIEEILRQVSGGSSQRGLMILKLVVERAHQDNQLQEAGISAKSLWDYAAENEAGISAAINISEALSSAPRKASDSADRILNLYEQSVMSSQGVLQTFQRLGKTEGIGKISEWKKFLTEAVASDLSSQHSSTDKNKLQLILQELKGFRLFNTLAGGLERVGKYIASANDIKLTEEKAAQVLQTTLDYIEQPIREFPVVQSWVSHKETPHQILFFQGYRHLLKSMPDDAYVNVEQKNNSLVSLQKKIDDLTYAEDFE